MTDENRSIYGENGTPEEINPVDVSANTNEEITENATPAPETVIPEAQPEIISEITAQPEAEAITVEPEAVAEPLTATETIPEPAPFVEAESAAPVAAPIPTEQAPAEKAGIRYDKDPDSDGNYTWKYSDETNETSVKGLLKKFLKIAGVSFAALAVVSVIYAGITGYNKTPVTENTVPEETVSTDNKASDTEEKKEKPVIGGNTEAQKDKAEEIAYIPGMIENNTALSKQKIAVKCKPSSVGIEVTAVTKSFYGYSYKSSGVGSGFILTEDGYIATNNHVISGATEITVMLDDGSKHKAEVVGADAITDLAVIKIDATGLTPMEIGDSDLMQVGDSVIAIGTPAGIEFAGTVTDGIVSAINRDIEVESTNGHTKTMTLMQTNAAINPGNSGGPLINDRGQVIGINTLKLNEKYEGIGFSIPINSAVKIFNQLITDGKVTDYESSFVTGNGAIGITNYVEVTAEESEYYGIPEGIMIIQLQVGASSQKAGLRRGDIITHFNSQPVKTVDELNTLKNKFKAGDEVTLTVYRSEEETFDITFKLDLMS
ncbi:MAG: trypsin-like peptidase domain-containing protein [Clostridia bacterium]|nr:trypsin-like peptidase domain-containing protein [Clostridia bacterium]